MALDPVPWFIGGGAKHSPDVARAMTYAASGGAEGVVDPTSLKVNTLPTPGTSVRIDIGACLILNRSTGGSRQSYVARAGTATDVPVSPTTSGSGRSDLVVIRVKDHQYSPWQSPSDLANGPYVEPFIIQNVPPGTISAAQLGLTYSAVALARLDLPPSTATVTSSMIVDVRAMARPRQMSETNTNQGNTVSTLTSDTFIQWPPYAPGMIVPDWATHAQVRAFLSGVRAVGPVDGSMRVGLVDGNGNAIVTGPTQLYDQDDPLVAYGSTPDTATGGGATRFTVILAAYGDVRSMRNQYLYQRIEAHRLPGRTDRGDITVDNNSQIMFDINFYERPV